MLQGTPGPALAAFAHQHQVTEIVLARGAGEPAGRYPVLRSGPWNPPAENHGVVTAAGWQLVRNVHHNPFGMMLC